MEILPIRVPHQITKLGPNRLVQESRKRLVKAMDRNQLDDIREVFMCPSKVPQAAGELGLDQCGERQHWQALDL